MNLRIFTSRICKTKSYQSENIKHNIIFNLFGDFYDFTFSTKGSIHVISVGMERSNGIPMEIFRLTHKQNLACLTCGQSGARTHTSHSGEMIV